MAKSDRRERPIRNKLPLPYANADYSGLSKDDNWSTGDGNMQRQRREAHVEALRNEGAHYNASHPYVKPHSRWLDKGEK